MKLIILTAIFAAVASSQLEDKQQWQVGKVYNYDVTSHTVNSFEQGNSNGHGLKTQFIISVKAPGRLLVKLENTQYVQVKTRLSNTWELPSDLKYEPYKDLDQTFELFVSGSRIVSANFGASLSITLENVLKGLISALQLDLTSYNNQTFQSVFKKMEADVTGNCETLYSISPMSSEWRREIPKFSSNEDPIEIVKSKNYGNCQERVESVTGVPDGAVWAGLASGNEERQFITHNSETRLLVDQKGTIYKSQIMGFVYASPLIYGKQKAEVYTHTKFLLNSVTEDNTTWQMSQDFRSVNSLLYSEDPSTSFYTRGDEQNMANAQELLQDLSLLLKDPNDMPKGKFLVKFNLLVYVIASLNTEQLTQLTTSIGVANASKNATENNLWFVYRDAVALTGTPEGFQLIKSWILTKKVGGNEAADLMTAIGASISKPSKAFLEEFFHFSTCEQVTETKFLNNSALLALTKLFRLADDDKFTVETVIPYLSKQLKNAVETGDSNSVIYITVLGNLAHPAVLNVFAPYFEGQVPVSKYLRTKIVMNLKNLANRKDPYVRSVLYSIVRNTGEPYELRVAAALNIFLAFPTFEMMRILGYMAKNDLSTQLRAVLKSGITFAAGLKDPRFTVLAKSAQAVLDLVPEEQYGSQYSTETLHDGYSIENEFSFFRELSYIGSNDHFLPKYYRTALRFMGTGLTEENQITLSLSSLEDLIQFFLLEQQRPKHWTDDLKFSAQNIIEMLTIKKKTSNPLEASIFIEVLDHQKFFSFRQDDFNTYKRMASEMYRQLRQTGFDFKYTKLLYNKKISVMFPLVSGMPFLFEYREPVACLANLLIVEKTSVDFEINFTFARNIDGSLSYLDTLRKTFAAAGVVQQLQIHFPFKYRLSTGKVTFEPLNPGKDVNVVHFSVFPYTGVQNQNSIHYDIEFIERSVKTVSTDAKYGYWAGMIYQLQASSYSSDYKNVEELLNNDIITAVGNLLYQKDVTHTEIELNYLGSETNVEKIDLELFSSTWRDYKYWTEICRSLSPVSQAHCRELGRKVTTRMDAPRVELVDITAKFKGNKTVEYVFTAMYAYSYIDSKFQAGFIARGNDRLTADLVLDTSKAKIVPLNFEDALKNEIKVSYEANISNQKMKINLNGYGVRSKEYTELLRTDVISKHCLEEMSKDNYYQLDCHKMIAKAHALDYFKTTVAYKNFDVIPSFHVISNVYGSLKKFYSWEDEMNPLENIVDDKLVMEAQGFYNENFINYKLLSKHGQLTLDGVNGLWNYPFGLVNYGSSTFSKVAMNYVPYTGFQNLPYCAVDGNKVKTFSGRSYDYTLTGSWHVVMVDHDDDLGQNLVILARRPSAHQEEVYISLDSGVKRYIELNIKPGNISVNTNSEQINEGDLTKYWDEEIRVTLLEYYSLAEGIQVFHIGNGRIRMLYDQHRLVIIFTGAHRSTTKGICGENSGEVRDDYMTPWGLVDRPDYYGALFSLDEACDNETLALKTEAKTKAYQPVTKFTKIPLYV